PAAEPAASAPADGDQSRTRRSRTRTRRRNGNVVSGGESGQSGAQPEDR
ncbi:MAG: hypothetical protein MOP51_1474, partial [Citricoccus sp.]|nr:hypothetical protein [Citricoccus sp. WCRC_4]